MNIDAKLRDYERRTMQDCTSIAELGRSPTRIQAPVLTPLIELGCREGRPPGQMKRGTVKNKSGEADTRE